MVDAVSADGDELVDQVKASPANGGIVVLGMKSEHKVNDIHRVTCSCCGDIADISAVRLDKPLTDIKHHRRERPAHLVEYVQDNAGAVA